MIKAEVKRNLNTLKYGVNMAVNLFEIALNDNGVVTNSITRKPLTQGEILEKAFNTLKNAQMFIDEWTDEIDAFKTGTKAKLNRIEEQKLLEGGSDE